ncbi:MAG: hypothetical protein IKY42_00255, partial [Bacteroidaceae bacterium]|nr:hypothetical protein [Bacteroidaceae bacterium]
LPVFQTAQRSSFNVHRSSFIAQRSPFFIRQKNGPPELVSGSHREPSLIHLRGQMLKQVIRLRSSKTSFIFFE